MFEERIVAQLVMKSFTCFRTRTLISCSKHPATYSILNKMIMSTNNVVHVFQITSLESASICPNSLFMFPDWNITCISCLSSAKNSAQFIVRGFIAFNIFCEYYKLQSHYSTFSSLLSLSPFAVGILFLNTLSWAA